MNNTGVQAVKRTVNTNANDDLCCPLATKNTIS